MSMKPATKPARLGRGLSALFGDADTSYQPGPQSVASNPMAALASVINDAPSPQQATAKPANTPQMMPIEWIQPGAFQPRRHFDEDAIKGLADSIRERGVVQPLMVRPIEGEPNAYEIIAGERRWRAAQMAGLHEVPIIVREMSDREALEIGLIENVQRQDLSPLEEAEGYRRLMEEFQHSQDGLAKVVGKSRPHITNMLRLLTLPTAVKQMIEDGKLTMGHARALVTARNPFALAEIVVKKGMNVRQTEALARRESDGQFAKKPRAVMPSPDANILALEKELERVVGLRSKIATTNTPGVGSLTLYYTNLEQLDAVIKKLRG